MRPTFAVWTIALLCAAAGGQTPTPPPTVTSDGEAFVATAPAFADFWFTARSSSETLVDAATAALGFRQAVQAQLDERELKPLSVKATGVHVPSAMDDAAVVSVRVRFPVMQSASNDERVKAFAQLCADATAIRAALSQPELNCALRGPILGVENLEDTEQQAVSRATENALYKADAVASLLQSQVYAVQAVDVLSTEWLLDPQTDPEHAPGITEVTCRARVRVVYLITPGQ